MSHPLVLALYSTPTAATAAARALHALGIGRDQISVVSRNHDEAGALAEQMDASPGAEIEDSRPAARLGELGGLMLAAIALVMPGIGPIIAAGPMSADLGEAAGHAAGGVASVLTGAGVPAERAEGLQNDVQRGSVLIGVHVTTGDVSTIKQALAAAGATSVETANWSEGA
jgi:Heat induced stress protein YflT